MPTVLYNLLMPKKGDGDRKKLVVEEVEKPVVDEKIVSSEELQEEEIKAKEPGPQISEQAASTESLVDETPQEEMEKEIHQEEKHLHNIHTGAAITESLEKKSSSPILWILVPGIFLLGALLGGIFFYQKGIKNNSSPTSSPTPVGTMESPTPTPSAEVDNTKYSVRVENGSGVAGAAGVVQDILDTAGFDVSGVGNASSYDYTDTIIQAKSDVSSDFISTLKETLAKSYSVGKTAILDDSSDYEVIVVVGTSKAQ